MLIFIITTLARNGVSGYQYSELILAKSYFQCDTSKYYCLSIIIYTFIKYFMSMLRHLKNRKTTCYIIALYSFKDFKY